MWVDNQVPVTDWYKFSMAAGGRPTEQETFYAAFRKGGPQFIGFDLMYWLTRLGDWVVAQPLPQERMQAQFRQPIDLQDAFDYPLEVVYAAPRGSWVHPREPLLTVRGPSALVSFLEPQLLGALSFLLQASTFLQQGGDWREIIIYDEQMLKLAEWLDADHPWEITPGAEAAYLATVYERAVQLARVVDPVRVFEVGLRACPSVPLHQKALQEIAACGFQRSSSSLSANPVGTMGHEGVMRWGRSEELAFGNMAEALQGPVIFLIDTTSPEQGMAEAWRVIRNSADPTRFGMRPDSGDLGEQFRTFVRQTQEYGIQPLWIFEDGLRPADVQRFDQLRADLGYPADRVLYGLGGFLVAPPQFSRDQISLVYKLSHSARFGPVRKRGAEVEAGSSGKGSLPGAPCLALSPEGHPLVYQEGLLPPGYVCAELAPNLRDAVYRERPDLDAVTQALIRMT